LLLLGAVKLSNDLPIVRPIPHNMSRWAASGGIDISKPLRRSGSVVRAIRKGRATAAKQVISPDWRSRLQDLDVESPSYFLEYNIGPTLSPFVATLFHDP